MAFWEKYPWLNFEDLNLDWLLCNMHKLIAAFKDLGGQFDNLQDAFTGLKQFVNDYFDNLDVQEQINNKLDDMAKTGELADLLAGTIYPYSTLVARKKVAAYGLRSDNNNYVQGGCYTGNNHYIVYRVKDSTAVTSGAFEEYDIGSPALYRRMDNIPLGHGNSITMVDNSLYALHTANYGSTIGNTVFVYNYSTLAQTRQFNTADNIIALCSNNNLLYALTTSGVNQYTFRQINVNNGSYVNSGIDLAWDFANNPTIQDIAYDGKNIYVLFAFPNMIIKFSATGRYVATITIPTQYDQFPVGEAEALTITDDGDIYWHSIAQYNGKSECTINVYQSSLSRNVSTYAGINEIYRENLDYWEFTVDNTNQYMADGVNYPFRSLGECLSIMQGIQSSKRILFKGTAPRVALTYVEDGQYTLQSPDSTISIGKIEGHNARVTLKNMQIDLSSWYNCNVVFNGVICKSAYFEDSTFHPIRVSLEEGSGFSKNTTSVIYHNNVNWGFAAEATDASEAGYLVPIKFKNLTFTNNVWTSPKVNFYKNRYNFAMLMLFISTGEEARTIPFALDIETESYTLAMLNANTAAFAKIAYSDTDKTLSITLNNVPSTVTVIGGVLTIV